MSRTNNYTFFYPASMVWRSRIKIGCPTVAVKVEFVKKRAPQNVHYSCNASKKSKPRTINLFSSLLFVLCKKGNQLVKNVNSYTEGTLKGTIPQNVKRTSLKMSAKTGCAVLKI